MRSEVLDRARRILASWPADGQFHLDQQALDDWVIMLANARWLYVDRKARKLEKRVNRGDLDAIIVAWLQWAQTLLIIAAVPELDSDLSPVSETGTDPSTN
jgi:hypothetical protein